MKKLLIALFCIFIIKVNAQDTLRICGTPELPVQFENWLQSITPVPGKYGNASTQSIFNIPVIVHLIHNNEAVNNSSATNGNNLNAAQVIDQINILNRDFSGKNTDTSLIPAVFKPLRGKFQVNFCLAVVNPTGGILAEPGIDRVNRVTKGWNALPYGQTYMDATVKPNTIWDPNRYLNIWVAPLSNGLLGYATFPNPTGTGLGGLSAPYGSATTDGVVITVKSFGSVGTAQSGVYNKGRTSTHEIGHWMGLRHIWGDASCGTDYCNDTPPAQNANYGCPAFPYKKGVCTGNTAGEMTMNFMDYTNDACMYMFTADQKFRAQLILSNAPFRAALASSTVCNLPSVTNDIGISLVSKPTYSQTFNCLSTIDPVVTVKNYGSTTITSAIISFNVNGTNPQTLNWTGSAAPNASFTLALPQITGLSLGAHILNVTVSSPNGGVDNNPANNMNQQQFTILNNFAFNAPSGAICPGNSLVLTATGATSYSWNTGVTTASISLSPAVTTTYEVTGFYGACAVPKTVTVTVQTASMIQLDKQIVCEGQPALITASGASSYTWSSGETSPSISVNLSANANYTVNALTSAGCIATQSFNVLVSALPTATATANYVSCASCMDASVSVLVSGGTSPYTYNWNPGNITTAIASGFGEGCYTVTVTDANGCSAEAAACVSFDTGIFTRAASESFIQVSPNPGQGKFHVEFSLEGKKKIEVIDAIGRSVKKAETTSGAAVIDLENCQDGVYYLRVTNGAFFTTFKIVKHE